MTVCTDCYAATVVFVPYLSLLGYVLQYACASADPIAAYSTEILDKKCVVCLRGRKQMLLLVTDCTTK